MGVFDLEHCPVNLDDIAPLPLLIAPGGSDFDFDVDDEVAAEAMKDAEGSWVDSVRSIEIRKEPLENVDYEEFRPNFTEMGGALLCAGQRGQGRIPGLLPARYVHAGGFP